MPVLLALRFYFLLTPAWCLLILLVVPAFFHVRPTMIKLPHSHQPRRLLRLRCHDHQPVHRPLHPHCHLPPCRCRPSRRRRHRPSCSHAGGMRACVRVRVRVRVRMHACVRVRACVCAHACMCVRACVRECMHVRPCMRACTCVRMHACACMRVRDCVRMRTSKEKEAGPPLLVFHPISSLRASSCRAVGGSRQGPSPLSDLHVSIYATTTTIIYGCPSSVPSSSALTRWLMRIWAW